MTRWISLACVLIVLTGAAMFVYQTLPEPVPEPTVELHPRNDALPPKLELTAFARSQEGEPAGEPGGGPARTEPSFPRIAQGHLADVHFHQFGTMTVQTKGSHSWEFKNVGEGPLEVWLEDTSCACTVATLKTEAGEPTKTLTIAPGRSNPIEVTWEGRNWGRFGQSVTLGTNDPDNPKVRLTVLGTILAPVEAQPSERISFPEISTEEAHRATVSIVSPDRPELKLTRIAASKPGLIVARARPMTREELEKRKVKAGYTLTVEIKPGMPLGRFTEDLIIDTDHPDRPSMKLTITGNAIGPISVVPDRLQMPRVASRRGASQSLTLVVHRASETHFEVASKPEKLEVAIARDDKPGATGRYRLTVTVPPGTAAGVMDAPIVLKTDHPKVSEVRIPVSIYVSSRSEAG